MIDEGVVQVKAVALELGVEPDVVVRDLGDDVFRSGGFRVCTAAKAAELIERHEARRAEAAARKARRRAEAKARAEERREAGRARGQAARESARKGESQITKMRIGQLTEITGTGDVPAAAAMMADAPPEYEGAAMTSRPSRLDWMMGKAEGGGTIGPVRRPKQKGD